MNLIMGTLECSVQNFNRMAGYFMGMHGDLRMRKVLVATILSAEFIFMTLNYNLSQILAYITDDKSWNMCYVYLKILISCLMVLLFEDRNISGMEKLYYYSKLTKNHIHKLCYYLDEIDIFPLSNSSNNIWNILDDYNYDEDCFEPNVTDICEFSSSEISSSSIFHYCKNS